MPTSENAMTGVGIGSALVGMRPIMSHQRVDFFVLALDQLINNAAKWSYMFDGKMQAPLVIRLVIGRGWGQGPQHSQSLQSLFAHIPGLRVVMPSNPYDAKGMMISAVEDNGPVVFLEHRWLHNTFGDVPEEMYRVPLSKAKVVKEGNDVSIVCSAHMVLEALKAHDVLAKDGINAEVVDVRSTPLDHETILQSVKKTGRVIVADDDWKSFGFGSEIITQVAESLHGDLKSAPRRICLPDHPAPTSWALSNHYYPTAGNIVNSVREMLGKEAVSLESLGYDFTKPMDVPDKEFTGPF